MQLEYDSAKHVFYKKGLALGVSVKKNPKPARAFFHTYSLPPGTQDGVEVLAEFDGQLWRCVLRSRSGRNGGSSGGLLPYELSYGKGSYEYLGFDEVKERVRELSGNFTFPDGVRCNLTAGEMAAIGSGRTQSAFGGCGTSA